MTQELVKWGEHFVGLTFIPASEVQIDEVADLITSVHVFPIQDDKLLCTENPRGIDIIGGHVDPGETYVEALHREAMEEACIELLAPIPVGLIRVDNSDNPTALAKGYPVIGYQALFVAREWKEFPFEATHECVGRTSVPIVDLPQRHHAWLGVHGRALLDAKEIVSRIQVSKGAKL